jgi:hypothetical protein
MGSDVGASESRHRIEFGGDMGNKNAPVECRHRRQLIEIGMTDPQIRAAIDAGEITRTWRGSYHRGGRLQVWEEFALSARSAAQGVSGDLVLSHAAAASVLGLEVLNSDWRTIEFTVDGHSGGSRRGRRRVHVRRLDAEDVTVVDGIAVTTAARTALDLALAGNFEAAIVALDSALRSGVPRAELDAAASRLGRRRGMPRLRAALPHATHVAESVGESWSRALMLKWPDIPRPTLQREYFDECGALVARADFLWSDLVVGEFDGLGKGETPAGRLRRDSLLSDRGLWPTHWGWLECREPDRLHERLKTALGPRGLLLG